jgi:hypothetical protein
MNFGVKCNLERAEREKTRSAEKSIVEREPPRVSQ